MRKNTWLSYSILLIAFLSLAALRPFLRGEDSLKARQSYSFGPEMDELLRIHSIDSLPDFDGHYFVSAGVCDNCHGNDPNGLALVDQFGIDVNMVDDWRSTMMANSAKDPFWRAQVSHEVLTNPGLQTAIEDKCLQCHAPLGRYTHFFESQGQANYSMAMLANDTLGLDGVSCMSCHSQRPDSFGLAFSGHLFLDTIRSVYGQYPGPNVAPMFTSNHLNALYGPHIQESRLCAGCHTLITETVDLQGALTGGKFAEQATYHEWVNSNYVNLDMNCQTCHMPSINDFVYLSGPYVNSTNARRPFSKHHFAGSNTFMLKMLKQYADSLNISAQPEDFDSTIARTNHLLRYQSLDLELYLDSRDLDSVRYSLKLINKAGHKFPSGYPSRRIFVEFVLQKANGDTVFKSGLLGSNYEVLGQDPSYEPHYDLITNENQAQIYEFIMADVNGNVTTTLERAATHLKDNRIPPQGFLSSHSNWDTVEIAGNALSDPNFNHDGATEGTGSDIVRYHIPLNGYAGNLEVSARVWYQTVRPGWLDETFSHSSPDIDRFERWFNSSDRSVQLVAEVGTQDVIVANSASKEVRITLFPNPTSDGWISGMLPAGIEDLELRVLDMQGKIVLPDMKITASTFKLKLPAAKAYYFLDFHSNDFRKSIRVLRN